ncbi:PilZ domain-containing protein [Jannaschia sp. M317]|uniref:PilZ domain-containing protein n=1 Tax=Jannaschia sp. M317 TaxID=2867011 RepID=UPI0021A365D6|nr:PilZ domain-containing protein [Jannaschia sp. M317]UWQ16583.1 PilZ domain-containing protein [Jannaschia sp. M317]
MADLTVTLHSDGGRQTARVLDVSPTGVKVAVEDEPAVDARITLQTARRAFDGHVRWVDGGRLGLSFDRPLSKSEQSELAGLGWGF